MIDFKSELQKISFQDTDKVFLDCKNDIAAVFKLFTDNIGRIYKKQGEMSIQLEEMYSLAEEREQSDAIEPLEKENVKLVRALIFTADIVEDFYRYYETNYDESMTQQASVMWGNLCKALAASGVMRIADENTPFDANLNTVENIVSDAGINHGYIAKVLKSGYIYKNEVIRKSSVIVNKMEAEVGQI